MYGIRRPCEVSINGYEWVLEEDSEELAKFADEEEALQCLYDHGMTDNEMLLSEIEILRI